MESSLLSVKEAIEKILVDITPVNVDSILIEQARNFILAKDLIADTDLPRFTDSSMDGFAVIAKDISTASADKPVELNVVADIPAGTYFEGKILSGQSARVMTGGTIPQGADTVVPVEDTNFNYRSTDIPLPEKVLIFTPLTSGVNIRIRGQDIRKGQLVISSGSILRSQEIGILAMLGHATVEVYKKPLIGVLSTGDEIIALNDEPKPGKIFDSNSYVLAALVGETGGEAVRLGIARDNAEEIRKYLDRAVELGVDLIISSAGVSVGAFDFVRKVIEKYGQINFWRVNMRPGKPLAFGNYRGTPILCLPGNTVSSFVGFIVFGQPLISKLRGIPRWDRSIRKVILEESIISDGRESYLRSKVFEKRGKLYARLTGHQGSGNLYSLIQANALIIIPSEVKSLPAGAEVNAWILSTA